LSEAGFTGWRNNLQNFVNGFEAGFTGWMSNSQNSVAELIGYKMNWINIHNLRIIFHPVNLASDNIQNSENNFSSCESCFRQSSKF